MADTKRAYDEKPRAAYAEVRTDHPSLPAFDDLPLALREALITVFFAGRDSVLEERRQ
jgi:hypothetical protein